MSNNQSRPNRFHTSEMKLHTKIIKAGAIVLLLFVSVYLCIHFQEYQKNATSEVNKYRIDQVALLDKNKKIEQHFVAGHTHLKTLKIYFSNDYAGAAKGRVGVDIFDAENGVLASHVEKDISELGNFEYTDFPVNVFLNKGREYVIRITTKDAESGKEPVVYQWTTKEHGFLDKLHLNGIRQRKYLIAKMYYPVTIYTKWMTILFLATLISLLIWFGIPLAENHTGAGEFKIDTLMEESASKAGSMSASRWPKAQKLLSTLTSLTGSLLYLLAPIFTFWMVERFTDNDIFRMNAGLFALNLLVYYMFFLALTILLYSRRLAVTVGMIVWFVIGIGNYFVLSFRGFPIIPSDLLSASTGFSVAANYSYQIQPVFVWNFYLILLYLTIFWNFKIRRKTGWKNRAIIVVGICIVSTILGHLVIEQKTLKSVGIKNNVWDQKKGYAKNGLFFGYVLNLNSLFQEKPSDYSAEAAKTIALRYEEYYANQDKKDKPLLKTPDGRKPNVIMIMNEAWSDLSVIGNFKTTEDYMPFYHGLEDNTIKGHLYMSIFGSGTCNSEFEVLTGNTMSFLQSGIIAYTQVIKDYVPGLTQNLKDQGYRGNVALHPYLASGWNRIAIYDLMGFEHFYSQDDFKDPLMYRKYISDASDFDKIEELYEQRDHKDKPFYLFNVTMQNHGGFDKMYSNFDHTIKLKYGLISQQAEQYLTLVKKTDEALEQLLDYFSKVEEPTIIVMFGDHEPSVESAFYNRVIGKSNSEMTPEEMQVKYQTPFMIWCNYDIEEKTIEKMSANYLGAYVAAQAGLKLSPYQEFLLDLREKLPVLSAMGCYDKDGNYYENPLDSPYVDMVKEYQILQYNNLIDTEHTVKSFFKVKKK